MFLAVQPLVLHAVFKTSASERKQVMNWKNLCALVFVTIGAVSVFGQCCTNGINLLAAYNPDFSITGNPVPPGFETDNDYSQFLGPGLYSVIVSRDYGACFGTPQYDHTVGNEQGAYLWYDTEGNTSVLNPEVAWQPFDPSRPPGQENTLDVTPNTTYVFSVWIRDLAREPDCINGGAPVMGLRINGQDMSEIDLGDYTSPCCPEWVYLCTEWNSGNSTQVLIEIESRSGIGWTDLGIDDVYFGTTSPFQQGILGEDVSTCVPQPFTLNTGIAFGEFLWSTGETTSSIVVNEPGIYWVDVDQAGCSGRDSIEIAIGGSSPVISLGSDLVACEGEVLSLVVETDQPGDVLWSNGEVTPSISVTSPGIYSAVLSTPCGSGTDEVEVSFVSPPTVILSPSNGLVCDGLPLQLQATTAAGNALVWSTGNTGSLLQVNAAGLYVVSASNTCGSATAAATIAEESTPSIALGPDVTACNGTSVVLGSSNTVGTYLWNTGASAAQLAVNTAGIYSVTSSNACGTGSDEIEVIFVSPIAVELGNDTTLCEGVELLLSVDAPEAVVTWSTGTNTSTLLVNTAGTYSVTVDNGCLSSDEIEIVFLPLPQVSLPDTVYICPEAENIVNAGGGPYTYLWSDGTTDSTFQLLSEGVIDVQKFNACGWAADTVRVFEPPLLVLPIISDTVLCFNQDWLLVLDTLTFPVVWENGSVQTERLLDRAGEYTLEAANACGTQSETFTLSYEPCNCDVYIPNAFTPDLNGLNDFFFTKSECSFEAYELVVYNRWGEEFFRSNDPSQPWNGGVQSHFAPDGVYTYSLTYQFASEDPMSKQGFVVLIR
jgi:gliding motility-associated-like protein